MSIACIQPPNWLACVRVDEWLPPYINDIKTLVNNPPYSNEKNAVQMRQQYERLQRNLPPNTHRTQLL